MLIRLFRVDLTGAGRPVLLTGEVERGMLDKVGAPRRGGGGRRQAHAGDDASACCSTSRAASLHWCLPAQVDLVFHGPGGVEEHPADEYKARRRAAPPSASSRCCPCARLPTLCMLPLLPEQSTNQHAVASTNNRAGRLCCADQLPPHLDERPRRPGSTRAAASRGRRRALPPAAAGGGARGGARRRGAVQGGPPQAASAGGRCSLPHARCAPAGGLPGDAVGRCSLRLAARWVHACQLLQHQ